MSNDTRATALGGRQPARVRQLRLQEALIRREIRRLTGHDDPRLPGSRSPGDWSAHAGHGTRPRPAADARWVTRALARRASWR
jgi:hypothetical protein